MSNVATQPQAVVPASKPEVSLALAGHFLALDFETGGTDPQTDGPVQLAVVAFDHWEPVDRACWIIKPATNKNGKVICKYDVNALAISGLTWKQIQNGDDEITVLRELVKFAEKHDARRATIVSHNAQFDAAFLSQLVFRCGIYDRGRWSAAAEPLWGPWACTRRMAYPLGLENLKLDTVAGHFGLARTTANHDACEDAELCGRVYAHLMTLEGF